MVIFDSELLVYQWVLEINRFFDLPRCVLHVFSAAQTTLCWFRHRSWLGDFFVWSHESISVADWWFGT